MASSDRSYFILHQLANFGFPHASPPQKEGRGFQKQGAFKVSSLGDLFFWDEPEK